MPEPVITVPLAQDWITRLLKLGGGIWIRRKRELDRIFLEFGDCEALARTYVEPDCQTGNPADLDEDEPVPTWAHRVAVRRWLNDFLSKEFKKRDGRNVLFVLSDAGMGKSSLLMMLKLSHLLRFWPDGLDFHLLKLGRRPPRAPIRATDEILNFVASWIEGSSTEWLRTFPWDLLELQAAASPLTSRLLGWLADLAGVDAAQIRERGKWQERGKLYASVQEVTGDSRRSVAILDHLRRGTRDGNDLYQIELALAAVEKLWPDQRSSAKDLRRRLFKHVPAPAPELFRSVDTGRALAIGLWREIPAGSFRMGSPATEEGRYSDEGPRHEVVIEQPFRLAAMPVTNAQFAAFDPEHKPRLWEGVAEDELARHPVVNVTWYQAVAFCRWLSSTFEWARGARLPTEEEWEYACRAGTESRYWSGDAEADLARAGWYRANSGGRTHRVGGKAANPWGLYDVHGNVWEWTLSAGTGEYSGRESGVRIDPSAAGAADLAATPGGGRVVRGGCCWSGARGARSACRDRGDPGSAIRGLGFRVLLPAARAPAAPS